MIPTRINGEINREIMVNRLEYLTSQLPSTKEAFILGRQFGRPLSQRRIQLLMLEIQLTHRQLASYER